MNCFYATIPHSGETIPSEASWLSGVAEQTLLRDVDRFVDKLYEPGLTNLNIPYVKTQWHRYVIDLNRRADDIDVDSVIGAPHASGTFPRGLHWSLTTLREKLMPQPIALELHQKLVQKYFEPFHHEVRALQKRLQMDAETDVVFYHVDLHSMPSVGTSEHRDPGEKRKDIVVSDCGGKSCRPEFTRLVLESYQHAGFSVAHNWPYLGGRITEMYGKPQHQHHSIQVELNRGVYMDESTRASRSDGAFEQTQAQLQRAIQRIQKYVAEF